MNLRDACCLVMRLVAIGWLTFGAWYNTTVFTATVQEPKAADCVEDETRVDSGPWHICVHIEGDGYRFIEG